MLGEEIENLIKQLAKLPGLGPRSARRAALHLLKKNDSHLWPLQEALKKAAEAVKTCSICGALDTKDPCAICIDVKRDVSALCVVEQVADVWALERSGAFRGRYHVVGGVLSALDGVTPDDLNIASLVNRARAPEVKEVILALNATVDGQITAHY